MAKAPTSFAELARQLAVDREPSPIANTTSCPAPTDTPPHPCERLKRGVIDGSCGSGEESPSQLFTRYESAIRRVLGKNLELIFASIADVDYVRLRRMRGLSRFCTRDAQHLCIDGR